MTPPTTDDIIAAARTEFSAGNEAFARNEFSVALVHFLAAKRLMPDRPSILVNLGVTYLALGEPEQAIAPLKAAVDGDAAHAEAWHHLGAAYEATNSLTQAQACWDIALGVKPTLFATRYRLALLSMAQARWSVAHGLLAGLVKDQPDSADAWLALARCEDRLRNIPAAMNAYRSALACDPDFAPAYAELGALLKDQGEVTHARRHFDEAIARGDKRAVTQFLAASVGVGTPPDAPPPEYVRSLFDAYADGFDEHLAQLEYNAPDQLARMLRDALQSRKSSRALDLGCGTGQMGALLTGLSEHIQGVDMSERMQRIARTRGCYDAVHVDDIRRFLEHGDERWDLFTATDVFIYLGDLSRLFQLARARAEPGALFAFTVESLDHAEQAYALQSSSRYAHSIGYVMMTAQLSGWRIVAQCRDAIRREQGHAIQGDYFVMVTTDH